MVTRETENNREKNNRDERDSARRKSVNLQVNRGEGNRRDLEKEKKRVVVTLPPSSVQRSELNQVARLCSASSPSQSSLLPQSLVVSHPFVDQFWRFLDR